MERGNISIAGDQVKISPVNGNVWLTQHEIARTFDVFISAVGSNIRSILKSGILREEEVYRRLNYKNGGFIELYNLEMIIALSYRIKSRNTEVFRVWLTKRAVSSNIITVWAIPTQNVALN